MGTGTRLRGSFVILKYILHYYTYDFIGLLEIINTRRVITLWLTLKDYILPVCVFVCVL